MDACGVGAFCSYNFLSCVCLSSYGVIFTQIPLLGSFFFVRAKTINKGVSLKKIKYSKSCSATILKLIKLPQKACCPPILSLN